MIAVEITVNTDHGKARTRIENTESYRLKGRTSVTCADLAGSDTGRAVCMLRFRDEFELIDTHRTKNRARIHAKMIQKAYQYGGGA